MTAFGARQRCPDNTSENLKVYNNVTLLMPTWVSFKVADDYLPFFFWAGFQASFRVYTLF